MEKHHSGFGPSDWTGRGKTQRWGGKKGKKKKNGKKENSQKMFHAVMSLGRRKQSCNPILIAVDLLNRSSRFKSQQITQKAQGDGGVGVCVGVGGSEGCVSKCT